MANKDTKRQKSKKQKGKRYKSSSPRREGRPEHKILWTKVKPNIPIKTLDK